MEITESIKRSLGPRALVAGFALAGLMLWAQAASGADSGPTETGDVCMQHVYADPVSNSNSLNCTANDVRISRAVAVSPGSCIENDTFTLTGTFEIDVTANIRYDTGFFFRIDGGSNARGDGTNADGTCSLSKLNTEGNPGLNLDGDSCGDLYAGKYLATFTIPGVKCVGVPDPDNPGQKILQLPNCTSWHSNQGTSCNINSALDFHPDTKSKCVCADTFTVPVIVEEATLEVVKTASPTTAPESGGTITFTVNVTNQASFVSVTIATLTDNIYGNIADSSNTNVTENSCPDLVGDVLGPKESANCSFKVFVSGNSGDTITDVVEVCSDQNNTGAKICDDDDADVTITDEQSTPSLAKTAQSAGCTVNVMYQVVVSNNSSIDTLTVDSLTDNMFGDITKDKNSGNTLIDSTNCATGGTILANGNYTCEFVGTISSSTCSIDHSNTVTAETTDDDGAKSTLTDDATVKVDTTFP